MTERILKQTQSKLIDSIVLKFGLKGVRLADTPFRTDQNARKVVHDRKTLSNLDLKRKIPYREAVGALLYLANCARPDISHAVNKLTRRQACFDINDWHNVERVIQYIAKTRDKGLVYSGKGKDLVGYSDASLGRNDPQGHSTSGGVIKLWGDSISWHTSRQKVVATSSMEAEYIAMNHVAKRLLTVYGLVKKFIKWDKLPIVYCDNSAVICAMKAEVSKSLGHLYRLEYHFVRNLFATDQIELRWVSTKNQIADALTKSLPKPSFEKFSSCLLENFEHPEKDKRN